MLKDVFHVLYFFFVEDHQRAGRTFIYTRMPIISYQYFLSCALNTYMCYLEINLQLRIEDTFSPETIKTETFVHVLCNHSSPFEDRPYKVYIFLKLRRFCNNFQKEKTKQVYINMYHHWELRVLGTLSQVGVSGYFEIHLLYCATYFQMK